MIKVYADKLSKTPSIEQNEFLSEQQLEVISDKCYCVMSTDLEVENYDKLILLLHDLSDIEATVEFVGSLMYDKLGNPDRVAINLGFLMIDYNFICNEILPK